MLKGHVFKRQVFGNQIFALFIDTFLNGKCGISNKYGEKMQVTYNGSVLYVNSGCACIKGRFLEEDTSTEIVAGTENAFCKLVIEIDLDKENTDENLLQATYKVIKSNSNYPALTQTDIVANNSGVYQFELAQFKTTASGITDFADRRTYLDFESIYAVIKNEFKQLEVQEKTEYKAMLDELEELLENVTDGSAYVLKEDGKGLITDGERTKLQNIATEANKTVINNTLTSTNTSEALSANQGRALKSLIDSLTTTVNGKQKAISRGTSAPSRWK